MKRIQRKRTKGWRMPKNAVYVGRGTKYGNPYVITKTEYGDFEVEDMTFEYQDDAHHYAVILYRRQMLKNLKTDPNYYADLKGKDLACFCPPHMPCHADAIIEFLS